MLRAYDKDEAAEEVENMYDAKQEVMLEDTVKYLKEVEHMEVL